MKKLIVSLLCLLLAGCSNVSKEEYDLLLKENNELKTQVQKLSNKLNDYSELEKYNRENESGVIQISGGLVLTVDAKLVDPNIESKTPRVLIVRPFQSNQEVLAVNEEIAKEVEVGKTYFFEMKTKTIEDVSLNEVKNTINLDLGAMQWLEVVNVREPQENEYGLADNLHIEKMDK